MTLNAVTSDVTTGPLVLWLLGALPAIIAGYVQGLTGMGFAVVFTPLMLLVVQQPHQVVLLSLLLGAVLSVSVLIESRRALRVNHACPLFIGALAGTPLGVIFLTFVNAQVLTILIAGIALVVATAWLVRLPPPLHHETSVVGFAGLLGGFLNGSTSMGGPPPALISSIQRWPIQTSRAALVTFNLTSYLLGFGIGFFSGLIDVKFLLSGLALLPIAFAGSLTGGWFAQRISQIAFRYALAGTVWLAGLLALISALW